MARASHIGEWGYGYTPRGTEYRKPSTFDKARGDVKRRIEILEEKKALKQLVDWFERGD